MAAVVPTWFSASYWALVKSEHITGKIAQRQGVAKVVQVTFMA